MGFDIQRIGYCVVEISILILPYLMVLEKRAMDEIHTQVRGVDPKKVTAADRDNDGMLSVYEFCNALHKDFEGADLNEDGTLDIGELEILMKEAEGK